MKRLSLTMMLLLAALAGCKDITRVQTGYVADRDSCRVKAETRIGIYNEPSDAAPMDEKNRNNALLQLFCECMKTHDWNVAGCVKPKEKAVAKEAAPAPPPAPVPAPVIVVQQPPPAPAPAPVIVQQQAAPAEPAQCPEGTVMHKLKKKKGGKKFKCVAQAPLPADTEAAPQIAPAPAPAQTPGNSQLEQILSK